ncbi:MAG: hypothetical protein ACO2PM_05120 [Pyrobaculum sp.]
MSRRRKLGVVQTEKKLKAAQRREKGLEAVRPAAGSIEGRPR